MIFYGFGERVVKSLLVLLNLLIIFLIIFKRREREVGLVFELVVNEICDEVIVVVECRR